MNTDEKRKALTDSQHPLAAKYDPDWILENEMGSPALWLVEDLTRQMSLQPGMRVWDMGCGKAMTSIFLAKEFGVQVFANDWWISATDNWQRIRAAGVEKLVVPIHGEAHALPYADDFFDAAVCVNSYQFYGTADTYFNDCFVSLIRSGGEIAFALPGIYREFEDQVPDYLAEHWQPDFYYFHSLEWWRRYFRRRGTVDIRLVDDFGGNGNAIMMKWEPIVDRMRLVRTDNGRNMTWVRVILQKR